MLLGGARPNFVKVAPVLSALERRGVEVVLVHTGQHTDPALSAAFFTDLAIRAPDEWVDSGPGTAARQTAAVLVGVAEALERHRPDLAVVVGDVNATLGSALAAAQLAVPVAHVEAGLRCGDRSMPEELNRMLVDSLSDWLLTPSADAEENLLAEGIDPSRIFRVGNVMADSLLSALDRADPVATLAELGVERGSYVLATLHRPATVDDADALDGVLALLGDVARDRPVLLPAHPRTAQRLAGRTLPAGVRQLPPLPYLQFVAAMDGAALVITDSGGVQEETSILGVPCLTYRTSTERPATVSEGTNVVVGTDPARALAAYRRADLTRRPSAIEGWDGKAADRVADVLTTVSPPLAASRRRR